MTANNIHMLSRVGDLAAIRRAIRAGIDIDLKDEFGSTALHCAIAEKQIQVIQLLLELGADVRAQDSSGRTALHYAIEFKLPKVLKLLLEQCPSAISVSDIHGNQPLWTAVFNAKGKYDIVSMLLHYPGADPRHLNKVSLSPLDIAIRRNDSTLTNLLKNVSK